jgi:hypothetical protein
MTNQTQMCHLWAKTKLITPIFRAKKEGAERNDFVFLIF